MIEMPHIERFYILISIKKYAFLYNYIIFKGASCNSETVVISDTVGPLSELQPTRSRTRTRD